MPFSSTPTTSRIRSAESNELRLIALPDQVLPAPDQRELPVPWRLRAMLGPGIILAGLSIGSGEFVLWPRLTAQFGFDVFWAAWIGVTIQFFLNMEIERYTLATGGATLLHWEIGGPVTVYAVIGLVVCGLVLSLGPVVYRTVEALQIGLVSFIFLLLAVLAFAVVRADAFTALFEGAIRVGHVPDGIELPLLLGALAFAGAGGTVNLAQSNYIRDKG